MGERSCSETGGGRDHRRAFAHAKARLAGSIPKCHPVDMRTEVKLYEKQWEVYRKRTFLFWIALLGGGLVAVGSILIGWAEIVAGPLWLIAVAVSHLSRMFWPCPRCRRPYHATWFFGNPLAQHCLHCDLPKWASHGEER